MAMVGTACVSDKGDAPPLGALSTALRWLVFLQLLRYAVFLVYPAFRLGAPVPFVGVSHSCLAAYLRAAELARLDPTKLYDGQAYLRGAPTSIAGLGDRLSDVFQYPPTFLLGPEALLRLGLDYRATHALVWVLELLFVGTTIFLTTRGAGTICRRARALSFAALSAFPVLQCLHYGQAHLIALLLGAGAYFAADRNRPALSGFLLALGTSAKLFPCIVLIPLLIQRRYASVVWSIFAFGALSIATILLFGTASFEAFFRQQLPALLSGKAFSGFLEQPEYLAANLSVTSSPLVLATVLGVSAGLMPSFPASFALALLILGLAVVLGLKRLSGVQGFAGALGLLTLASMLGAYVPSGYAMSGPIYLSTLLLALDTQKGPRLYVGLLGCLFLAVQPYTFAMPLLWKLPRLLAAAQLVTTGLVCVICIRSIVGQQGNPEVLR